MSINVSEKEHVSFAKIEAARDFSHMIPRASRKTNTAYKIDDLASIVCDVLTALEHQTQLSISRLMRYHYEGYTLEEIAKQDGCTEGAIRFSLRSSYGRIADWLESPKAPKPEPHYEFQMQTHTRSFTEPPHHIPPQR